MNDFIGVLTPCYLANHNAADKCVSVWKQSVTEHRVSTTGLGPATPNFAKLPQTQPLYRRTVPTMSRIYQQADPMESQTTAPPSPFTIDVPQTICHVTSCQHHESTSCHTELRRTSPKTSHSTTGPYTQRSDSINKPIRRSLRPTTATLYPQSTIPPQSQTIHHECLEPTTVTTLTHIRHTAKLPMR